MEGKNNANGSIKNKLPLALMSNRWATPKEERKTKYVYFVPLELWK